MLSEIVDYFDVSYIINLRTRPDKKREAIRQFSRFGVDINTCKLDFYTVDTPQEKGLFANTGQRGCFTSHMNLLKLAMEKNARNLLVFEDDVCFRRSAMQYAEKVTSELDQCDWDVVYFGFKMPEISSRETGLIDWGHLTDGAQFYAINRPFMKKMATYMSECAERPNGHPKGGASFRDVTYNRYRLNNPEVKTFLHVPSLASQSGYHSDLHEQKSYYNYEPVSSLIKVGRQVRTIWRGR